jgi:carbonic anhydrase
MRTLTKELQQKISPEMAVELLIEGNKRFVKNLKINRNLLQQVNETSESQHPFALVISCMDSRTSTELIFDQGLGEVFSVRIAGNVINEDILGSSEFACQVVGVKIVVVLGHTGCGAVKGAMANVELGHLTQLTNKIKKCFPNCQDHTDINEVTRSNVLQGISDLRNKSEILRSLESEGKIKFIGGIYDINSGLVEFFI